MCVVVAKRTGGGKGRKKKKKNFSCGDPDELLDCSHRELPCQWKVHFSLHRIVYYRLRQAPTTVFPTKLVPPVTNTPGKLSTSCQSTPPTVFTFHGPIRVRYVRGIFSFEATTGILTRFSSGGTGTMTPRNRMFFCCPRQPKYTPTGSFERMAHINVPE